MKLPSHWFFVCTRVLQYLANTRDYALSFSGQVGGLEAFSDSDWAGDRENRKSISGGLIRLGGDTIWWKSRQQDIVALSSCEAECVSACEVVREITYLKRLLDELLNFSYKSNSVNRLIKINTDATVLHVDNQSAIQITKNSTEIKRSKHIATRFHYIRSCLLNLTIKVQYCNTLLNLADLFTKALPAPRYNYLINISNFFDRK